MIINGLFHRFPEAFEFYGFYQIIHGIDFVTIEGVFRVGCGENNQRVFGNVPGELDTRDPGHLHVKENQIHGLPGQEIGSRGGVIKHFYQFQFRNPGNKGFQERLNSEIYVDKTGLIEKTNAVLDTRQKFLCVSRPRRFGKSYAANMLAAYYSKGAESEKMFSDLEIGRSEDFKKHLNKYDVIHIDVQWFLINCEDADNVVPYITRVVLDELREVYPEILRQEVVSLPDALSLVKDKTGRKFIIIIDEWDCVFREYQQDKKAQEEYLDFLRDFLKDKVYVALAYLTGILPIKKYGTHSALNMFDEFTMLDPGPLAEYVGFTEQEVEELCGRYQMIWQKLKTGMTAIRSREKVRFTARVRLSMPCDSGKSAITGIRQKHLKHYSGILI